jgi:inhibitor of cysteine peptidase
MKTKKYWLLTAVLGICALVTLWSIIAWGNEVERSSLSGLTGISVIVEEVSEPVEKAGLTQNQLKNDVELRLRQAGIYVLSMEESLKNLGHHGLHVYVICIPSSDNSMFAISVQVKFCQDVYLARDPKIGCIAATWSAPVLTGFSDKSGLRNLVHKYLSDCIDEFINDYLEANSVLQTDAKKQSNRDQGTKEAEHIEAKVGLDFVITLGSNPSTGYSWRLAEPLPCMLKLQNKEYIPAEVRKIGGGGIEEWTFKPVRSGKVTIMFEYARGKQSTLTRQKSFTIVAK